MKTGQRYVVVKVCPDVSKFREPLPLNVCMIIAWRAVAHLADSLKLSCYLMQAYPIFKAAPTNL
jgi:hypothetical protein